MRMTQPYGLSDEAREFLDANCKLIPTENCPHCGKPVRWNKVSTKYDIIEGMCGVQDGVNLYIYELKDGRKIRTVQQFVVWSSGPMIFECLMDDKGRKFCEWTREEVLATCGEDLLCDGAAS